MGVDASLRGETEEVRDVSPVLRRIGPGRTMHLGTHQAPWTDKPSWPSRAKCPKEAPL